MNPNAIALAAAVVASTAVAKFGPKPVKKSPLDQFRSDRDHRKATAAQQSLKESQIMLKLAEDARDLTRQNRYLVDLLIKHDVTLDEFDRIALKNLTPEK